VELLFLEALLLLLLVVLLLLSAPSALPKNLSVGLPSLLMLLLLLPVVVGLSCC
jgi:hypothetical protein